MLSKWEELALIAKCATTDSRSAFERLVVEYSPELRRYLMNLTLGDASLTDDLAQDTFLKAYMSIRSFQGLSRFKTWLFRIAINEYYAYVRKRREQRMDGMAETPVIECVTPLRNVEAGIDAQKCLAVLSETERSVVLCSSSISASCLIKRALSPGRITFRIAPVSGPGFLPKYHPAILLPV